MNCRGIYNDGSDQKALLTVITSTLTGNTASDSSGGLANGYNDDQFIQTHNGLSHAVPKGVTVAATYAWAR